MLAYEGEKDLLVGVNSPAAPCGFDSSDPLLGKRLVAGTSELPCIACYSRLTRILWFNIQPKMLDWNVVVVDCGKKLAYLGRD